jgi:hypothetical protein
MALHTFDVEYTDTFGGEANYCWFRRYTVTAPEGANQGRIMRAAKYAAGLSGMRGRTCSMGDGYEFRPYSRCTVLFVTFSHGSN